MFKPLIPIVSDAIAHTFNETIHIATVHAKYGSHHLAIAVASGASEDNNKSQTTTCYEQNVPIHIVTGSTTLCFCIVIITAAFNLFRAEKWATVYLPKQIPPPKLVL